MSELLVKLAKISAIFWSMILGVAVGVFCGNWIADLFLHALGWHPSWSEAQFLKISLIVVLGVYLGIRAACFMTDLVYDRDDFEDLGEF